MKVGLENDEIPGITEVVYGDDDIAYTVELSVTPFGETDFAAEDNSRDSAALLRELGGSWEVLWPEILERLQDGIADYDLDTKLGSDEFMGFVSRTKPGEYKSGEADIFVRLEFEEPPLWDFYLKHEKIVHSQPVF